MFETRITELFGIKYPIIQGGMQWVATAELVSAVSNAGGLGILSALSFDPEGLREEIRRTKQMTDRPFGVNLTFLPTLKPINYEAYIDVIAEEGVGIVETAGRNPEPYMKRLKDAGIKVIHKCTAVRFARKAQEIGCDAVSIDGFECAGHPGEEDVTSLVLIPITVDAVDIPVVASGGFADARGFVAALALGAEGVNMGTRFLATKEAPVHENIKRWLLEATERDTVLILRSLRNTARVLRNSVAEKVLELEAKGEGIEAIGPLVSGANGKRMLETGDRELGVLACSQAVGLVREIPTVAELVEGIVSEAKRIITDRLSRLV